MLIVHRWDFFRNTERDEIFLWTRSILLNLLLFSYFNIWCEAKAGWSVYMKRRTAVQKISSLSEASSTELANFDDVCAICYQEMTSAKITRCKHYFHGVCLRKWLYVQDKVSLLKIVQNLCIILFFIFQCPLCHEIVINTDLKAENTKTTNELNVNDQQNDQTQVSAAI